MLKQKPTSNQKETQTDFSRYLIIACATVMEEMLPLMPPLMSHRVLDFGLHVNPGRLKLTLQEAIDAAPDNITHIILGYGLCSQAVLGLKSGKNTLIVPKVDDCIAIFLGSRTTYYRELHKVPGTYYLTKGWLKTASTPFDEFEGMVKRYGYDKAHSIMNQIFKNYTRLAFINTGSSELETYHVKAKNIALKFGLKYEEIQGTAHLVNQMIFGPWDNGFVVVKPGATISFNDFVQKEVSA